MDPRPLQYSNLVSDRTWTGRLVHWAYRRRYWIIGATIAAVVAGGFIYWEACCTHVDNPSGYSTAADVQDYLEFPIPTSASHIRTAGWRHGMGFSRFIRFEAPVADCLGYALRIAKGKPLTKDGAPWGGTFLTDEQRYIPGLLVWFDVGSAKDLVGAEPGPMIGVDQLRGVFYYYEGF
jgi:hypothetical protein